jgi:hypothetical protein
MAKMIEFYGPSSFRRNAKWTLPAQTAKLIQFNQKEVSLGEVIVFPLRADQASFSVGENLIRH